LRQRILFEHRLEGLAEEEVAAYVAHRLAVAGHAGAPLLSAAARRSLHRASRGLPRLINILMHKALLLAYGEGALVVGRRHLKGAIADTPSASRPRPWWWLLPRAA
jgi:MSHA biogenesis protein MshM